MLRHASLAVPTACLVAGVSLGLHAQAVAGSLTVPLAGALAGSGASLANRQGAWIAALGLGLLLAWGQPALTSSPPGPVDPDRPVLLSGRLTEDWQLDEFGGWRARLRVSSVRQRNAVVRWSHTVGVSLTSAERPPRERKVRVQGYLKRPPGLSNGRAPRSGPWSLRVKSQRLLESRIHSGIVSESYDRVLRRVEAALASVAHRPAGPVLECLLLGRSRALGRSERQQLRRLGLSHLFAVSGLHVALLAAGVGWLSSPLPRGIRTVAVVVAVALYALLSGARPSMLRASLMAGVGVLSLCLNRPTVSLQALSASVITIVVHRPDVVLDSGFQLTVSATAGIICLTPRLQERWTRLPKLTRRSIGATVGAQLGSAPWAWSQFSYFHPLAPISNLVAIPWMGLLLGVTLLWGGLACLDSRLAAWLTPLADWLSAPVYLLARLPPSLLLTWPLDLGWTGSAVAAAGLGAALLLDRRHLLRLVLVALACALVVRPLPDAGAELSMLDVGQGDSLLLRDGAQAMLIDGGGWIRGDIAARILLPTLAARGIRSLEALVVSHGDVDHCQGLLDLAAQVPVGRVFSAPPLNEGRCVERLTSLPWIEHRPLTAGESWSLGRWLIRALHPASDSRFEGNNRSLVLHVIGFGHRILLTGDIESEAERTLLRQFGEELASDILKIGHHGSATSTGETFLDAVAPRLALISVGRANRYGHPSPSVIGRLKLRRVVLRRTDHDGMVRLRFSAETPGGRLHRSDPRTPSLPGSDRGEDGLE